MRLPLIAYRLNAGRIFGRFFVCITHRGRKTGKIRQTILAVMAYDPAQRELRAIAPWSSSDWLKNITAAPALKVQTGLESFVPVQRFLAAEEIAALLEGYRRQHPIISRVLCRIPGWKWNSSHEEFLKLSASIRGIAFRPQIPWAG